MICGLCPENFTGTGDTDAYWLRVATPSKPFGMALPVSAVSVSDRGEVAMVTHDWLTTSSAPREHEVYSATRDSLYDEFGSPRSVGSFTTVSATYPDMCLQAMTEDGLTAFFVDGFVPFEASRSEIDIRFESH